MKLSILSSVGAVAVLSVFGGDYSQGVTASDNFGAKPTAKSSGWLHRSAATSSARILKNEHRLRPRDLSSASLSQIRGGDFADYYDEENIHGHHDNDSDDTDFQQNQSTTPVGSVSVTPGETLPPALSVKGGESTGTDTAVTTADTPPATDMAMKSAKWISFRNRAATAIAMMAFLGFLSYYFKEDGLMVFTVLLQAMMYQEMTTVIGGEFTNPLQKWWWFLSALVAWNGPKVMPWKGTLFQAISYGMTIASGIGATLQLNWQKSKAPAFREYIRQAAVVVLSSLLVVLPTSYWIATLEEFGMMWIFVPALYMIINDTMAYVGGQLIGKHALLPSISPKKTWEGFVTAALSTVGVAWWLGTTKSLDGIELFKKLYPLDKVDGLVLAVFASLVAPFGGFLASIIKRAYGQKDFGALLPGHGGLVDRLDCQMLLAPAVYFYLTLYKLKEGQVLD